MVDAQSLEQLFPPNIDAIPPEYRLIALVRQSVTLINGEIKPWKGPVKTVRSPIRTQCFAISRRRAWSAFRSASAAFSGCQTAVVWSSSSATPWWK